MMLGHSLIVFLTLGRLLVLLGGDLLPHVVGAIFMDTARQVIGCDQGLLEASFSVMCCIRHVHM